MKKYFASLAVILLITLSLMYVPATQLYSDGYMGFLGYLSLVLGVSAFASLLFGYIAPLFSKKPETTEEINETTCNYAATMGQVCFIVFFFLLITSALWFEFISTQRVVLNGHKNFIYDTQDQKIFKLDKMRVYIWDMPDNYLLIPDDKFYGRVSDFRNYSLSVMGEIIDPDSMAWKTLFYVSYALPEQHRLRYLKAGALPNFGVHVHKALNNAVDIMYREGFETFKTTQNLKVALSQELERQCALVFETDTCLMDLTLHIPYAPIPHSAAPPDLYL